MVGVTTDAVHSLLNVSVHKFFCLTESQRPLFSLHCYQFCRHFHRWKTGHWKGLRSQQIFSIKLGTGLCDQKIVFIQPTAPFCVEKLGLNELHLLLAQR